jgi:hypothetical protein
MNEYVEVEHPSELLPLHKRLSARLKRELKIVKSRTIGYPAGSFSARVRFASSTGNEVFYWDPWLSSDKDSTGSMFGHGSPQSTEVLNIDLQFNLPIANFHRKSGGAFVRHIPTNKIVMAHRGIVTLGHGRVSKQALFTEMAATVCEVNTTDGPREFFLISELDSSSLVNDIDSFALELRRTVRSLNADSTDAQHRGRTSRRVSRLSGRLRKYFDEFSGIRQLRSRRKSVADCYHGDVVKAIRNSVPNALDCLKSQAIDLTIVMRTRVCLFEVKTSAKP